MNNTNIQIVKKPDWVSWEDIQHVVHTAHQENIKRGIVMQNALLSGDKIKEKIGDGKIYVAIIGNKVVGTAAFQIKETVMWFGTHRYGYRFFEAVLPEYRGYGIYGALCKKQIENAEAAGIDKMMFDTHERNRNVIMMNERNGYCKVSCKVCKNHDNVVMVKWLNGCPYSHMQLVFHYWKSRMTVKLKKTILYIVKGTK